MSPHREFNGGRSDKFSCAYHPDPSWILKAANPAAMSIRGATPCSPERDSELRHACRLHADRVRELRLADDRAGAYCPICGRSRKSKRHQTCGSPTCHQTLVNRRAFANGRSRGPDAETRERIAAANRGRVKSPEERARLSAALQASEKFQRSRRDPTVREKISAGVRRANERRAS